MSGARRVRWRDTLDVWPSLGVQVQLCPWHWRVYRYQDDVEAFGEVHVGPITIAWGWNKGVFPVERQGQS